MTTPVVVAVDPRRPTQAHDAVTMGAGLAELLTAPLQAVHVFVPSRGELGPQVREHSRSVRSVLHGADADAEVMVYPGTSPARVLHHLCDVEQARCVVIGSGRLASEGTSSLGEVGEALLHGSRVPVIVVPAGYGSPQRPITLLAVAYGGTPESDAALARAQELANAVGGRVELIAAEDAATGSAVTRRLLEQAHDPVMIVPRLPDAGHEVALAGGMEPALGAPAP